jgi:tetratricopeptide (TPR) repeat protein
MALEAGEYGSAALRFRQAIAQDSKLARAYFYLSQSEFARGEYRAAVVAIHAGMKVDRLWPRMPIQPRADLFKGREAEFSHYLQRLTDTLAGQPNQATLLFLAGHQLWFDGRRAEALAMFQKARPFTADRTFIDAFLAAGGPGQLAKLPGAP